MPSNELLDHAVAKDAPDFYALLGLDASGDVQADQIRKAYRKGALIYHPDKNQGDPKKAEIFHSLQIAQDVLLDPAAKAAYDNARRARNQESERRAAMDSQRLGFLKDLEEREAQAKNQREGATGNKDLDERIKRLREQGRKRKEDFIRRKEAEAAQEKASRAAPIPPVAQTPSELQQEPVEESEESEKDRTLRVRWLSTDEGPAIDKNILSGLFSAFGPVDFAFMASKSDLRKSGKKRGYNETGFVIFQDMDSFDKALSKSMEYFKSGPEPRWRGVHSVDRLGRKNGAE